MSSSTVTVSSFIYEFSTQFGHVAAGFIAVTKACQYGGNKAGVIVTIIGALAAGIKEFYYDQNYEPAATRGSNLLDFSMYCVGMILGWFV